MPEEEKQGTKLSSKTPVTDPNTMLTVRRTNTLWEMRNL
jgi:hypothetical protein